MVVGEEEGQPVSVHAPHDRFDIEHRPVGRVEVQLSDAALTEPLRRPRLGAPATHIDGSEEKETLSGLHHHGPRHIESRVLPWAALGSRSRCTSKCRIGEDRESSKRTVCSKSWPCTHAGLLRNAMAAVQPTASLAYKANSPLERRILAFGPTPIPAPARPAPKLTPALTRRDSRSRWGPTPVAFKSEVLREGLAVAATIWGKQGSGTTTLAAGSYHGLRLGSPPSSGGLISRAYCGQCRVVGCSRPRAASGPVAC
jgi:hypothetical protein